MLKIISTKEAMEWDRVVKSFLNWDVYYLVAYAKSLALHGDGQAFLIYFTHQSEGFCYPVMQKDISQDKEFAEFITAETLYDWETPYGYGGPLSNSTCLSLLAQKIFLQEVTAYCRNHHIVSQFLRFHPLLQNQKVLADVVEHKTLKDTIYLDLSSEQQILVNMDSKNRNMVRKAQKAGVTIFHDSGEHLAEFMNIYQETMKRDEAEPYYYFEPSYYTFLRQEMGAHTEFFYAVLEGKIIAASIFFYNEKFMHYHLSGSLTAFRNYAPTNLLLYEAATWGVQQKIQQLHLGGGISGNEDGLFGFKKQFNKKGYLPFYIGRTIFNQTAYNQLLQIRQQTDSTFNPDNLFYIQYRKPR